MGGWVGGRRTYLGVDVAADAQVKRRGDENSGLPERGVLGETHVPHIRALWKVWVGWLRGGCVRGVGFTNLSVVAVHIGRELGEPERKRAEHAAAAQ